jgi:hypothetical protein
MMKKIFYLLGLVILTLGCWFSATFFWGWGIMNPGTLVVLVTVVALIAVSFGPVTQRVNYYVWVFAGFLILILLFLPASTHVKIFPVQNGEPFGTPLAFTLLVLLSVVLIVVAFLLNSGIKHYVSWRYANTQYYRNKNNERKHTGRGAVATLALSILLLTGAIYKFYWFMIWDTTYDGLGYLWLPVPVLAVFFSTILLYTSLPDGLKVLALFFILLIPVLFLITTHSQQVDFRILTEDRAERVTQALDAYYTQKGHYPKELEQLIPQYALSIPGPVIIYGQKWCYDGGDNFYRLGFLDREHWSSPRLIGRVFRSWGDLPDLSGFCEQEVADLQKRHANFPYEYWVEGE